MEIQNSISAVQPAATPAPPPAVQDGRPSADAAASVKDPTPEVPLPIPSSSTQTGLVSKSAMAEKDGGAQTETSGPSSAERMLKPYGINMLPEKSDARTDEPAKADETE